MNRIIEQDLNVMRANFFSVLALVVSLQAAGAQQASPPISSVPAIPAPGLLTTPPAVPNFTAPRAEEPKTDGVQPPGTVVPNANDAQKTPEVGGPTEVILEPKPVLMLKGQSTWDDGYENLMEAIAKLNAQAKRLSLPTIGRPKVAFLTTDDQGFRYEAMVDLIDEPTSAPPTMDKDFTLSKSATGKALKFTHTGAYDDIDTTYEAITAYLDEKGAKARNVFIEEYLKDTKSSEDPTFEMNVYVLIE